MISIRCHLTALCCALSLTATSSLKAADSFESQLEKLADDQYAVRMESKASLVEACCKDLKRVDALFRLIYDANADPEQVFLAREITREVFEKAIFFERGVVGFALNEELIVERVEDNGPAGKAGIQLQSRLLAVGGKSVKGKRPAEIYSMIHATRPGTKLEMEFISKEGEKVLYHPVVAPRSTIRSDEKPELRKKQLLQEWLEKKEKQFQPEAD